MADTRTSITIGGHEISVSNAERVLYPAAGFTKADVIAYLVDVADALLPVLAGRTVTRKRWPSGIDGDGFFEKNAPAGMPEWVPTITLVHSEGPVTYPLVRDRATLAWLGQVSALELHVPQWRLDPPTEDEPGTAQRAKAETAVRTDRTVETIGRRTDRLVIDLDPGPPAGLPEAAQVALVIKPILDDLGLASVPVTSGSKGIHIYARLTDGLPDGQSPSDLAKALGKRLATDSEVSDLVLTDMTRAIREGKVLLDWSQNNPYKTTIAPYSLRGRAQPMAAVPRTWDEIADPALRQLGVDDVRARLNAGIEPFAAVFGR